MREWENDGLTDGLRQWRKNWEKWEKEWNYGYLWDDGCLCAWCILCVERNNMLFNICQLSSSSSVYSLCRGKKWKMLLYYALMLFECDETFFLKMWAYSIENEYKSVDGNRDRNEKCQIKWLFINLCWKFNRWQYYLVSMKNVFF